MAKGRNGRQTVTVGMTEKRCPCCKVVKSTNEFYVKHTTKKPSVYCKPCSLEKCYAPKVRFQQQQKNSKARGFQWLLTLEQFESFLKLPCHYCGGPLGKSGSALDRIDNKDNYTFENCVPSCAICNWVRQDVFTYGEMLKFGQVVSEVRVERDRLGLEPPTLPGQRNKIRKVYKRRGLKSPWAWGPDSETVLRE